MIAKKPVKYCVVDAFTDSPFKGNPAAVCLLEEERDDEWLQAVTSEFNTPVTCYLTRIVHDHDSVEPHYSSSESATNPRFRLRWFSPVAEAELCGHATLAAAHFLFTSGLLGSANNTVEFSTLSGVLSAKRVLLEGPKSDSNNSQKSFFIELDFPSIPILATVEFNGAELELISKALNGASVTEIKKTTIGDVLVVFPSGKAVVDFQPDFDQIQKCPGERGVIITGLGPPESGFDFVSRFFCPKFGVNEDPVCGSAHCALAPYWAKMLGKSDFVAYQASPRGGILNLHLDEENQRLLLRGKAIAVMEGSLLV